LETLGIKGAVKCGTHLTSASGTPYPFACMRRGGPACPPVQPGHRIHTDAIIKNLIPPQFTPNQTNLIYAGEVLDVLEKWW